MRRVQLSEIPSLEHHCNSWVVIRKSDGQAIGEFYSRIALTNFNADQVEIKTTAQYLSELNS